MKEEVLIFHGVDRKASLVVEYFKGDLAAENRPFGIWEESMPGRKTRKHKGPQVGPLQGVTDRKQAACLAEAKWAKEERSQSLWQTRAWRALQATERALD